MSWNKIKQILSDYITCNSCRGTGSKIVNDKVTTCPKCNGDGVVKK